MFRIFRNSDLWTKLVIAFNWGSPFVGKASAFAGLGMGALMLFSNRVLWSRWYSALVQRTDYLSGFAWALLCSLLYGIAQVIYGYLEGNSLVTALQILVFNICPLYVFIGLWVSRFCPDLVRRYIRFLGWFAVVYLPCYLLFLNKLHLSFSGILPGSSMDVFGAPNTGSEALLGLFAYEPNLARYWLPILVLSAETIANQERSDWLGLGVAMLIWGAATGKLGRIAAICGVFVGLLAIAFIVDIHLPPIPGRGGEISAQETIVRAIAAADPEIASDLGGQRENVRTYYGTVYWRERWWAGIRSAVSEHFHTMLFGLGYGYPIMNLGGPAKSDTRSPHNILYFALAYSGIVGVAIFGWLQICVIILLWRSFKATGQIFGLAYYVAQIINAFFGNFLETPQAGIPFYLIIGLCIAPAFDPHMVNFKNVHPYRNHFSLKVQSDGSRMIGSRVY